MLTLEQWRLQEPHLLVFLEYLVRRNFPLRFGVFLEPSKRDGMMLKYF